MNLAVRTHLDGYIIPSTSNKRPAVPNHLTEVKGLSGGSDVLRRQATYAGAIGARAMHEVQNYGNDQPVYDGNAYTLVPTYNSGEGSLKIYATHPTQSATGRREYHMTQLDSYAMMGNANSFRQGATAFRNSRDLSKEYRDRFIAAQTLLRRRDRHPLPHPPAALQAEALPPQGPRAHCSNQTQPLTSLLPKSRNLPSVSANGPQHHRMPPVAFRVLGGSHGSKHHHAALHQPICRRLSALLVVVSGRDTSSSASVGATMSSIMSSTVRSMRCRKS